MSALAGAWGGAYIAFNLERKAKKQDKATTDVDAVQDATLKLGMMWNEVYQYRKQIVEPYRDRPLRHIEIAAAMSMNEINVQWERLVFLMPKNSDLLLQAHNLQLTYSRLVQAKQERDDEHLRDVQPKLEGATIQSIEEVMEILGQRLFKSMKNRTDGIIELVDLLSERLVPVINNLRTATIAVYPDADIPRFEFAKSSGFSTD